MKRMKRLRMKKRVTCVLAIFAMLALETTVPGRLAANRLAANRLSPYSAAANSPAASKLAASPVAAVQLEPTVTQRIPRAQPISSRHRRGAK